MVFDRDDFESFDEAVSAAMRNGFRAAWSNEAFEYWLSFYLGRYDSALSRGDWVDILDAAFEKNREDVFEVLSDLGDHEMEKGLPGACKSRIKRKSRLRGATHAQRLTCSSSNWRARWATDSVPQFLLDTLFFIETEELRKIV